MVLSDDIPMEPSHISPNMTLTMPTSYIHQWTTHPQQKTHLVGTPPNHRLERSIRLHRAVHVWLCVPRSGALLLRKWQDKGVKHPGARRWRWCEVEGDVVFLLLLVIPRDPSTERQRMINGCKKITSEMQSS